MGLHNGEGIEAECDRLYGELEASNQTISAQQARIDALEAITIKLIKTADRPNYEDGTVVVGECFFSELAELLEQEGGE